MAPNAVASYHDRMGHLDSHCHWDAIAFEGDRDAVVERAFAAGVTRWLIPGVDVAGCGRAIAAPTGVTLYRAAGIHPRAERVAGDLEALERLLDTGTFVAVGETGLDRAAWSPEALEAFVAQADMAIARRLPVILHVVHAHEEALAVVKARPGLRGVIHAFSAPWEVARRWVEAGYLLGVGGIATWSTARRLQDVVRRMPLEALVLETDAPDLSPAWRRGERNEPGEIAGIAREVALLRGTDLEAVLAASDRNAERVLGLEA